MARISQALRIGRDRSGRAKGFSAMALLLLLLLLAAPLRAQTGVLIQQAGQGRINWSTGELRAAGESRAPAQIWDEEVRREVMVRQALMRGRQNLYSALRSLRISSSLSVRDRVDQDPVLRQKLKGRVNNSVVLDRTVVPGERTGVKVEMKLWGDLSRMLIPDSVWYEPSSEVSREDLDREAMKPSGGVEAHTGLIVDARGLDVEPSLVCRIFGPEGRLVYGPGVVRPSVAFGRGMAGYMRDRRAAVRSSRTGGNPLMLRAEGKSAAKGCEIRVSQEASEALLPEPGSLDFLRRGRVIILVGSGDGGQLTEYQLED